jgi:hypothetical protein
MSGRIGPYPSLTLVLDSIVNSPVDYTLNPEDFLIEWNSYFYLPDYGEPFTKAEIHGNKIHLYGGKNILIASQASGKPGGGDFDVNFSSLIEIIDTSGCVISIIENAMTGNLGIKNVSLRNLTSILDFGLASCPSLTDVYFPEATTLGLGCFQNSNALTNITSPKVYATDQYSFDGCNLTNIYLPSCVHLGSSVGFDGVFDNITGHSIINLTIRKPLMTCNGGNPDGDIQYLIDNNTTVNITQT